MRYRFYPGGFARFCAFSPISAFRGYFCALPQEFTSSVKIYHLRARTNIEFGKRDGGMGFGPFLDLPTQAFARQPFVLNPPASRCHSWKLRPEPQRRWLVSTSSSSVVVARLLSLFRRRCPNRRTILQYAGYRFALITYLITLL